jgi:hypothetical protein
MGSLKSGASYIYERADGIVYAREFGADPSTRKVIGWEENLDNGKKREKDFHKQMMEDQLWGNIRRAAETDPTLQEALERVKVTYYLTKDYEKRYGNRKT